MWLEIYCLIHEIPYRTVPYGTGAEFGWDFVRAWYPRIGSYGRTVYRAVINNRMVIRVKMEKIIFGDGIKSRQEPLDCLPDIAFYQWPLIRGGDSKVVAISKAFGAYDK